MYRVSITIIIILFSIISCNAQSTLQGLVFKEGKTTIIKNVIDLKGKELFLPKNVTLNFEKDGCLKNGKIIANNTSITGYNKNIFDAVKIVGQWNVPYINTDMFKDISSLNSLQNVFALASDRVDNVVFISEGNYVVAASRNDEIILGVPSNTEVIINGVITMLPNNFTNYYVLGLKGENIHLHGKGEIVGDKYNHTGTVGEWGMGLMLTMCKNIEIHDLTIRDCWGDCVYIGGNSSGVRINNCTILHGRRQGISITSAKNILIENCIISNVGGTAPEYAIDIEPNENDTIESIIIKNVKSIDCKGGFLTWGGAKNCKVKNIELYGCYVEGASKPDYAFNTSLNIKIVNCTSDRNYKPINNKCKSFIVIE